MKKFKPGDVVEISEISKSRHKGAIGIVVEYCNGWRSDILRVRLWKNKVIQICESSLSYPDSFEKLKKTNEELTDLVLKKEDAMQEMHSINQKLIDNLAYSRDDTIKLFQKKAKEKFVAIDGTFECSEVEELIDETAAELGEEIYNVED